MVSMTIIIPAAIIGFLLIISGFIWWYVNKNSYRYKFKVISRDGKSVRNTKAKLVRDPDNPRLNKFSFKDNPTLLSVREPDAHEDGIPIRRLTFNVEGKYVYLEGYKVNEKEYLEASLQPEAKELSLYQFQANQRRNPIVNKTELAVLVGGIILFVLILAGVIFMMVKFVKTTDNLVQMTKNTQESTSALKGYGDVRLESDKIFLAATNNLASYCSGLTGMDFSGMNLTRVLPSMNTT